VESGRGEGGSGWGDQMGGRPGCGRWREDDDQHERRTGGGRGGNGIRVWLDQKWHAEKPCWSRGWCDIANARQAGLDEQQKDQPHERERATGGGSRVAPPPPPRSLVSFVSSKKTLLIAIMVAIMPPVRLLCCRRCPLFFFLGHCLPLRARLVHVCLSVCLQTKSKKSFVSTITHITPPETADRHTAPAPTTAARQHWCHRGTAEQLPTRRAIVALHSRSPQDQTRPTQRRTRSPARSMPSTFAAARALI
jgi:hypothetical protein